MNRTRTRMIGGLAGLLLWTSAGDRDAAAEGNVRNGLTNDAYLRNPLTTNRTAVQQLVTHALADALVTDAYLARQLHNADARAMMNEIVRCALDEGDVVQFTDSNATPAPIAYTWHGELGLCSGGSVGDWHTTAPTEACLQLVTGCVAARVNALGMSVPLALRGPSVLPPAATIVTAERYREPVPGTNPALGIPIGSFFDTNCPAGAECHWRSGRVGTCIPGDTVAMVIDGAECSGTPIRACTGLHGCMGAASGWSSTPYDLDVEYSEKIAEQASSCAPAGLTFECPDSGMFSVMVGPRPTGATGSAASLIEVAGNAVYPAPETAVFRYREGAFFGNMFEPGALTRECVVTTADLEHMTCSEITPTVGNTCSTGTVGVPCAEANPAVPYRHVYACFTAMQQLGSTDEDLGVAADNDRICDTPDSTYKCFPHKPTRCTYPDPYGVTHGAGCGYNATLGIFVNCPGGDSGDSSTLYRPITTYLADPCDLLGDAALCNSIREASAGELGGSTGIAGREPDPDAPDADDEAGGCAIGGPGAGEAGLLVALFAVARRRRRPTSRSSRRRSIRLEDADRGIELTLRTAP